MHGRNPGIASRLIDRLRGRPVVWRPFEVHEASLRSIRQHGEGLPLVKDDALRQRAKALFEQVRGGKRSSDAAVSETFALASEIAKRVLSMRPFDTQVVGGLVLYHGDIAEMATGEGKTLAAVAPACVHAMSGRGAHVLTFNDYLAQRDADWMRPVYEFFGLSVGVLQAEMSTEKRRSAYAADVTYATAKEVDEFTGRVVEDRHLPDGLQAAVAAKEGLAQGSAGTILGSITLQHMLGSYDGLAGMTATAYTACDELKEFYGMTTFVVPPNVPSIRIDHPDRLFATIAEKRRALVEEIVSLHSGGRPLLVGTASVAESEGLAAELRQSGVACQVS